MAKHTMNDIFDRFEREHLPTLGMRTRKDYERHLRVLRDRFGTQIASEVGREEIIQYVKARTKAPVMRIRQIAVLSSAFGLAVSRWNWLQANPCVHVRRNTPYSRRPYLTDEEYRRVWSVASKSAQLVMDFALWTGKSQGSILALQWSDVDEELRVIRINNPRSSPSELPLTPALRNWLGRCRSRIKWETNYIVSPRTGGRYTSEGFRALWQRILLKVARKDRFTFFDIKSKWENDRRNDAIPVQVQSLLDRPRESPAVELKQWIDLSDRRAKASVARHLAALANFGGGYLIFGFRKNGVWDQDHPKSLDKYNSDEFAGIVDKYLTPAFHCEVFISAPKGASDKCVVIKVPSHSDTPICAKADGPQENGRAQGIQIARYYTRVNGPKSEPISSPEQWRPLIQRCVAHGRQQLLESLLERIEQQIRPQRSSADS